MFHELINNFYLLSLLLLSQVQFFSILGEIWKGPTPWAKMSAELFDGRCSSLNKNP